MVKPSKAAGNRESAISIATSLGWFGSRIMVFSLRTRALAAAVPAATCRNLRLVGTANRNWSPHALSRYKEVSARKRWQKLLLLDCNGQQEVLLQRLARPHLRVASNVIALELAIQSGAADAEHLSGECLVAFNLFEDALNGCAFNVLEIGR